MKFGLVDEDYRLLKLNFQGFIFSYSVYCNPSWSLFLKAFPSVRNQAG